MDEFSTKLEPGKLDFCMLWKPDGSVGSAIWIEKEVWLNLGTEGPPMYLTFHVFNWVDLSKAHSKTSGGRVNPYKEPFMSLEAALDVAHRMRDEALASGKWVYAKEIKVAS